MNICILGRENLKYVHVVLSIFREQVTAKETRIWGALLSLIYLLCTGVTENRIEQGILADSSYLDATSFLCWNYTVNEHEDTDT